MTKDFTGAAGRDRIVDGSWLEEASWSKSDGGGARRRRRLARPSTVSAFGVLVWYWQQTQSPGGRAVSALKAVVWPAFLVYDALRALHR